MFIRKLGIDLGTANTVVFIPQKGIIINEPTVVAVSTDNNQVLAIGNDAKDMVGRTPELIKTYKPLKDGVIADYKITKALLHYFISKSLGSLRFVKPDIIISAPCGITSTERRAIVDAARTVDEIFVASDFDRCDDSDFDITFDAHFGPPNWFGFEPFCSWTAIHKRERTA